MHPQFLAVPSNEESNAPSTVRRRILNQIAVQFADHSVSSSFWAFCQVADVESLAELSSKPHRELMLIHSLCDATIRQWRQRTRSQQGSSSSVTNDSSRSSRGTQTRTGVALCNKRDRETCVLTNTSEHQVAHIYPHSLLKERPGRTSSFWNLLAFFWTPRQIQDWQSAIFEAQEAKDGCWNMICLSSTLHKVWDRGGFALRPLPICRDDAEERQGKALKVQFYWQPYYDRRELVRLEEEPRSSQNLNHSKQDAATWYSWDEAPNEQLKTGHIFRLTTTDPIELPLPDRRLLDMQWNLQRITAMRGGAEPIEVIQDFNGRSKSSTFVQEWLKACSNVDIQKESSFWAVSETSHKSIEMM